MIRKMLTCGVTSGVARRWWPFYVRPTRRYLVIGNSSTNRISSLATDEPCTTVCIVNCRMVWYQDLGTGIASIVDLSLKSFFRHVCVWKELGKQGRNGFDAGANQLFLIYDIVLLPVDMEQFCLPNLSPKYLLAHLPICSQCCQLRNNPHPSPTPLTRTISFSS